MMKRMMMLVTLLAVLLTSCDPQKNQSKTENNYEVPDIADIAMYQVNPRVFAPEKSLNAVAARIDSIQALGVNMIWVMPIYPIGIEKGKNSPYCISDYKAIAPEFGTIDEFKNLVKVCHEHGMGIILDWVANHTAWDHPWVKEHPDWYTHDEKTDTIISPAGFDWYDVADLNYDNAEMRKAMIDAMRFWIVDCGIDGFRCDVADGVPADFWKEAIETLRKDAGRRIVMLAEGKQVDNFTVGGFDMNYGWDYKDVLVKVFNQGQPASDLIAADSAEYAQLPEGKVKLRFTTNHDHSTEVTPVKEFTNARGSMAAYVASIFPHGGALIYGSQEVGYENPINFFKYVPVDWTANAALYQEYQHLLKLYNERPALRKGKMKAWPDKDILLFEKSDDLGSYLIAVNVRNEAHEVAVPEDWKESIAVNTADDSDVDMTGKLSLKPFEYLIIQAK